MNSAKQKVQSITALVLDYGVSVFCLLILFPVIIILSIAIKLSGKGPVIFSQKRVGKSGRQFAIYKFRSMHALQENQNYQLLGESDRRITCVGKFMRKYKLDEIPNFINVLKGQMSIIGPRPEQKYWVDQILSKNPEYLRTQTIKPGITSWGQVKYGYASNADEMIERFSHDLFYLENKSLWFDIKIIYFTFHRIVTGKTV